MTDSPSSNEHLSWCALVAEDLAKYLVDGGNMLHVRSHRALGILFAEIERLEKLLAPEPDGFTDALAQALYGNDPGAVRVAMKHADTIEGDTTDAHALRRLAEEVRRLRAAPPPSGSLLCDAVEEHVIKAFLAAGRRATDSELSSIASRIRASETKAGSSQPTSQQVGRDLPADETEASPSTQCHACGLNRGACMC